MTRREAWLLLLALLFASHLEAGQSTIVCRVIAKGEPVTGAEVVAAGKTYVTDQRGEVRIDVDAGSVELTAAKAGFAPVTTTAKPGTPASRSSASVRSSPPCFAATTAS